MSRRLVFEKLADCVELLAASQRRSDTLDVLEKIKLMLEVSAKTKPELANGLRAAMGLVKLYEDIIDPAGKLGESIDVEEAARILATAAEKANSEKHSYAVAPTHPSRNNKSGKFKERILALPKESFFASDVPIPEGESMINRTNAIQYLIRTGIIKHGFRYGEYEFVKKEISSEL